jgi:hypothetical protein
VATSGRGSGVLGYNVKVAVDTEHHLIIAHEVTDAARIGLNWPIWVTSEGSARHRLEAVADRGYYSGSEILACNEAGIEVTLPKPMTSGAKANSRFGRQDFVYVAANDGSRCPACETLTYHHTDVENSLTCATGRMRAVDARSCTDARRGVERRVRWWGTACSRGRATTSRRQPPSHARAARDGQHPFGTLKMRMGATHFLMKRLPKIAGEMALQVRAYNFSRVMNIIGVKPLIVAMRAYRTDALARSTLGLPHHLRRPQASPMAQQCLSGMRCTKTRPDRLT